MAERPPPRATLPPLRQRVWTPATQRRLLQDALLGVALYRRLRDPDELELMAQLEKEFDALLESAPTLDEHGVYCLKFPPALPGRARSIIGKIASCYHLQSASFGEEEKRFIAVYLHPRDAMAPPLRMADYAHALSYYSPPPPPPPREAQHRNKYQRRDDGEGDIELEATAVLPLQCDYSPWATHEFATGGEEAGYECEIADCHAHILELKFTNAGLAGVSAPQAAKRQLLRLLTADELAALRPLPDGWLAVFKSANAARGFVARHADGFAAAAAAAAAAVGADDGGMPSRLSLCVVSSPPAAAKAKEEEEEEEEEEEDVEAKAEAAVEAAMAVAVAEIDESGHAAASISSSGSSSGGGSSSSSSSSSSDSNTYSRSHIKTERSLVPALRRSENACSSRCRKKALAR